PLLCCPRLQSLLVGVRGPPRSKKLNTRTKMTKMTKMAQTTLFSVLLTECLHDLFSLARSPRQLQIPGGFSLVQIGLHLPHYLHLSSPPPELAYHQLPQPNLLGFCMNFRQQLTRHQPRLVRRLTRTLCRSRMPSTSGSNRLEMKAQRRGPYQVELFLPGGGSIMWCRRKMLTD
ncbi:hypothetical protein BGZ54_004336, partial [Gamsiella multidivaricata]